MSHRTRRAPRPAAGAALVLAMAHAGACGPARVAETGPPDAPPVGMHVVRALEYPPLRFEPPVPDRFELSNGVTVFFLRDRALPLVEAFIDIRGGYIHFDREYFGAVSALLPLMRGGGTRDLPPDSVDELLAYHALGLNTSTDGGRMMLGVAGLSRHLELAIGLWSEVLLHPRFDAGELERWRARELEAARRIGEFPGSLAVHEFNRIMFGDHPTGWALEEADLAPRRLEVSRLRELHRAIICPEHAVIGAAGDVTREALEAALEAAFADWAPCGTELDPPTPPVLVRDPSVYIIPKPLSQTTIVVGQPGGVRFEESEEYFASRVANWVLGGSGMTSRLFVRLRTEEGLAYSAATVWGTSREHERIFGAITHTRAEATIDAVETVLATLRDARIHPPTEAEVALARESIANGFVFGFGSAGQIVARQVSYLADDLPADWMTRYLNGIRAVRPSHVARVLERRIDPDHFTILIVGDTAAFDPGALGPYTILPAR